MHTYINTPYSQPVNQRTKPSVSVQSHIMFHPTTHPFIDPLIHQSIAIGPSIPTCVHKIKFIDLYKYKLVLATCFSKGNIKGNHRVEKIEYCSESLGKEVFQGTGGSLWGWYRGIMSW